jgi:hypothetical protein
MTSSAIFICIEYIFGLILAILAVFYWPWGNDLDLFGGILISFLKGFIAIFVGVSLVGFLHLKRNRISHKYGRSLLFCFVGLVLFSIIYSVVAAILPGFFILVIPLTGAVLGFNFKLTENSSA